MESKGINSPYTVALISGLVLGFGCELLTPLTDPGVSDSLFEAFLPLIALIVLFVIVQQVLQRFFGFQGFILSGDNGKGKRFPSYLLFFAGYFVSRFLIMIFTTKFFSSLPN